jgi:hypothetical protein
MFKELDAITLIAPIPLDRTWDIPSGSPLLKTGNPEEGLLPGDVGTIVYVQGGGEAFEVEFLEPDGYTVAIATVLPSQMRPMAEGDISRYRFWKKAPA